jgi:hypothetical protein
MTPSSRNHLVAALGHVQVLVNEFADTEGSASAAARRMAAHITAKIESVRRELAVEASEAVARAD